MASGHCSSDDDLMVALVHIKKKHRRRMWIHDILKKRVELGEFHRLVKELELDHDRFRQYFRMTREQFLQILHHIGHEIEKADTGFRKPISPRERLAICLRYLATGDSFKTIAFSYRVGASTVAGIVNEVCRAIWIKMSPINMPAPQNEDDWLAIADQFDQRWNFPNCVGAIDGKHVVIQAPQNTGSLYFNYKGTFSIVLLAVVDASYRFIMVDIGGYGRHSDGVILAHSQFGRALSEEKLKLPQSKPLPGSPELGEMPFVFVADEAFPLKINLMRPFPGKRQPEDKRLFNYRLSRARRIVENAFGILAARWRLYLRRLNLRSDAVTGVVKATCVLHNFLQEQSFICAENTRPTMDEVEGLQSFRHNGSRYSDSATDIRNKFTAHFNSEGGSVSWQLEYVRRGQLP